MNEKNLTCIVCPLGCSLSAQMQGTEVLQITGNSCPRGAAYAKTELVNPTRTLTTTMAVHGGVSPVVAVKSQQPLPKDLIFQCMEQINQTQLTAPVQLGETVIANILNTGVNIVATKRVEAFINENV